MGGFCSSVIFACCHWQESSQLGPSWILFVLGPRDRASALSTSFHNWAAPEICFTDYLIQRLCVSFRLICIPLINCLFVIILPSDLIVKISTFQSHRQVEVEIMDQRLGIRLSSRPRAAVCYMYSWTSRPLGRSRRKDQACIVSCPCALYFEYGCILDIIIVLLLAFCIIIVLQFYRRASLFFKRHAEIGKKKKTKP